MNRKITWYWTNRAAADAVREQNKPLAIATVEGMSPGTLFPSGKARAFKPRIVSEATHLYSQEYCEMVLFYLSGRDIELVKKFAGYNYEYPVYADKMRAILWRIIVNEHCSM